MHNPTGRWRSRFGRLLFYPWLRWLRQRTHSHNLTVCGGWRSSRGLRANHFWCRSSRGGRANHFWGLRWWIRWFFEFGFGGAFWGLLFLRIWFFEFGFGGVSWGLRWWWCSTMFWPCRKFRCCKVRHWHVPCVGRWLGEASDTHLSFHNLVADGIGCLDAMRRALKPNLALLPPVWPAASPCRALLIGASRDLMLVSRREVGWGVVRPHCHIHCSTSN